MEEVDEQVGAEHRDRGWPRRLVRSRSDGTEEYLAYRFVAIDLDAESIPEVAPEVVNALRQAFDDAS